MTCLAVAENKNERMFRQALVELAKTEDSKNGVVKTLNDICTLYGCWSIEENASHFLKYGFFNGQQMDTITNEVTRLCAVLRVSAVALTDAFNFSDHIVSFSFPFLSSRSIARNWHLTLKG